MSWPAKGGDAGTILTIGRYHRRLVVTRPRAKVISKPCNASASPTQAYVKSTGSVSDVVMACSRPAWFMIMEPGGYTPAWFSEIVPLKHRYDSAMSS